MSKNTIKPEDLVSIYDKEHFAVKQATKQGYILCKVGGSRSQCSNFYNKAWSCTGKRRYLSYYYDLTKYLQIREKEKMSNRIIELGNMNPPKKNFQNPQVSRIYSIEGIAPTLRACIYKDPPRILVARRNDKFNASMKQLADYVEMI